MTIEGHAPKVSKPLRYILYLDYMGSVAPGARTQDMGT